MINDHPHKRIADGILRRYHRSSADNAPTKQPFEIRVPAGDEQDELTIHSYSPSAEIPAEPDTSGSETGFAPWSSFPKKKGGEQNPVENDLTLSERIMLPHALPRHYAFRGMITGVILIVGTGIAVSTVFSRATVRVKPKIEIATIQNVSVIFDASISQAIPEQKTVPAEHLHFTQTSTQEIGVSATQYVEARARGTAKISNRYSTAPQRLVAQTRFLTPSGVLFRLAGPVVVPGATLEKGALVPRSVDVELVADAPGEQPNLSGEVQLKIPGFQGTPKYDGFAVVAPHGFSGGSRGMKKIASDADMQQAEQAVTKKAYDELKQQMQQKIPPGLRLVDGLQEIRIVKVEAIETRQQAGKLAVQAIAEGDALVFHEDDVVALLKGALLPQDGTKKFVDNSVNLTYAVHTLNFDRGRADALIQGSVKTKQPLTQAQRDDLATALSGKKQGSVREFFHSRNDVALSSLSIFPPWRSALPANAEHIRITEEGTE